MTPRTNLHFTFETCDIVLKPFSFCLSRYWQTRTHCCRPKCFPVCPHAQHLLRTQILCPGHKIVSNFVQKHFVSATNVSQFAQPRKHHEQQCVRDNVSSFISTLNQTINGCTPTSELFPHFFAILRKRKT